MKRLVLPFIAVVLAGCFGCAKPNTDVLHTLSAISIEPESPTLLPGKMALEVLPVHLPEGINRAQMVEEIHPGTLRLAESHRWGNGLGKDIQRVLVDYLSRRLPSALIVAFPNGVHIKATHRIQIEIHHLTGKPGGSLALQGTILILPAQGSQAAVIRRINLDKPVPGLTLEALVEAHSRILADLSREIAEELTQLSTGKE